MTAWILRRPTTPSGHSKLLLSTASDLVNGFQEASWILHEIYCSSGHLVDKWRYQVLACGRCAGMSPPLFSVSHVEPSSNPSCRSSNALYPPRSFLTDFIYRNECLYNALLQHLGLLRRTIAVCWRLRYWKYSCALTKKQPRNSLIVVVIDITIYVDFDRLERVGVKVSSCHRDLATSLNLIEKRTTATASIFSTGYWQYGFVPIRCRSTSFLNYISYSHGWLFYNLYIHSEIWLETR